MRNTLNINTKYIKTLAHIKFLNKGGYARCTNFLVNSKELPMVGKINWKNVRKETPLTNSDIEYLLSIPKEQLALFAGIIDGDGYISIVKSDKKRVAWLGRPDVSISLKIGLVYKDLPMLESFKTLLKIGRISGPYKNIKGQDTIYLIFNRTELQQVLYPLFRAGRTQPPIKFIF
jgi:hypothetical protein